VKADPEHKEIQVGWPEFLPDGRQYLVIMAGGHHFMETPISDALVAYALPAGRG